jgi:hypothetical protein
MIQKKHLLWTLLVIDAVVAIFIIWRLGQRLTLVRQTPTTPTPAATTSATIVVQQTILYGDGRASRSAQLSAPNHASVLSALQQSQKVEIKHYDFGDLVESIDGVKNGTKQKYWTFKVNGKESTVGAGAYQLQTGDQVEWKFSAYEK